MLLNYLKLSLRNVVKHKSFSVINIVGLAIGIAACLILSQYTFNQYNYDSYHTNYDNIFRVEYDFLVDGNKKDETILIDFKLTEAFREEIPQVKSLVRFGNIDYVNNTMVYKSDQGIVSFNESKVYIADKELFNVFDFQFKEGTSLKFDEPGKIILTESIAKKYFGDESAVGEKVTLSGNIGSFEYEVLGILKDLPENTHFDFNILLSFPSEKNYTGEEIYRSYFTYILTGENPETSEIISAMNSISDQLYENSFEVKGSSISFFLQPLSKVQLYYPQFPSFKAAGDRKTVNILIMVAVIILLIAWFNYINLSTVKAIERSKEIGIRKVLGSGKKHILMQFLIESFLINIIAAIVAFTLLQLSRPLLNNYLEFPLSFGLNTSFWLVFTGVLVSGALLSAIYPASIMMGYSPLSILSKKISLNHGGVGFRKILVVSQFAISVVLIAATITVYKQVNFMTSADLGMNIQHMVIVKSPPGDLNSNGSNFFEAVGTFKTELESSERVSLMTTSSSIPGESISWATSAILKSDTESKSFMMNLIAVGESFDSAYGLELLAGRSLKKNDNPWSTGDVVINEEAASKLGFDNPEEAIGRRIVSPINGPIDLIIRGVVENHNHTSLKENYAPIMYMASVWTNYYSIKLNVADNLSDSERLFQVKTGVDHVREKWGEIFPNASFDYFFLDETFDSLYKNDRQFGLIFGLFSGLAIIIASLGLLGLSSFSIARRTKEIGVRKVLGASNAHVVKLLSKEYVVLILIANVIAIPMAWYFLSEWLQNYHFRISLGWWLALVPMIIVLLISLTTISTRVLKVANGNSVDSLRYE